MLEGLFGSVYKEKILLILYLQGESYARKISFLLECDLSPIQNQLEKMETGGILVSKLAGKTRLYSFNPRFPFLEELKKLIKKMTEFYSREELDKLTLIRTRPRRKGKPL